MATIEVFKNKHDGNENLQQGNRKGFCHPLNLWRLQEKDGIVKLRKKDEGKGKRKITLEILTE